MSQRSERSERSRGQSRGRQPTDGGPVYPRGAGVYPADFVPAARPDDYVVLKPQNEAYQVSGVTNNPTLMAFDADQSNGITASSNTTTTDQDATELEQRPLWLAQYRLMDPDGDIPAGIDEVKLDLGGAQAPLWTSKGSRGFISQNTAAWVGYSGLTEIYVWGGNESGSPLTPKFSFENNTGSDITINDIKFAGFEMQLEPVGNVPPNHVPVTVPTKSLTLG